MMGLRNWPGLLLNDIVHHKCDGLCPGCSGHGTQFKNFTGLPGFEVFFPTKPQTLNLLKPELSRQCAACMAGGLQYKRMGWWKRSRLEQD